MTVGRGTSVNPQGFRHLLSQPAERLFFKGRPLSQLDFEDRRLVVEASYAQSINIRTGDLGQAFEQPNKWVSLEVIRSSNLLMIDAAAKIYGVVSDHWTTHPSGLGLIGIFFVAKPTPQ